MRLRPLLRRTSTDRGADCRDLAEHPLLLFAFDEAWYLGKYPDVLNSGMSGTNHFLRSGVHEWRSPAPHVDLRFVAESLPQPQRSGANALRYLLDEGIDAEVRTSPFVDIEWLRRLSDDPSCSGREILKLARRPGPSPSPWIDLDWYTQRHPEMHLGGLDPLEYFLSVGRWLNRFPHPVWDEMRYLGLNDYVRTAIGSGKFSSGFEQFCAVGWSEVVREATAFPVVIGGIEEEFSESRYLSANGDVRLLVDRGAFSCGLEHLMVVGHREVAEGRRLLKTPSPLATATSRSTNNERGGDLLVLMNHFDVDGTLDPHVRTAISAYRHAGADVVLISPSTNLEVIDAEVVRVVTKSRNDDLRDFGGWYHALRLSQPDELAQYSRVILTNDSVYFPVRDPEPFFDRLRSSTADVFAATDSVSGGRYHLQSYFLALSQRSIAALVPELERRVRAQSEATKLTLIQRFEVGLSEYLLGEGMTSEVFFPLRSITDIANALHPPETRRLSRMTTTVLNTTHHFWKATLTAGLPHLKVELLRDNPVGVSIDDWQEFVTGGACTAADIEAHLARVRG